MWRDKTVCTRRRCGTSLIELIVAIGVMSIVIVGAFTVMREGVSLVRTNQRASDAQLSLLRALSHITSEAVNAKPDLMKIYPVGSPEPTGLVFASPLREDGSVKIDPITAEVYWQKWICFFYEEGDPAAGTYGRIYRCEEKILPPDGSKDVTGVVEPGVTSRTTTYFKNNPSLARKLMGQDISGFDITEYTGDLNRSGGIDPGEATVTFHKSYTITAEAGDKNDYRSDGYFIQVESQVTPRG